MPNLLQKLTPARTSTQTGARLAELLVQNQAVSREADKAREAYTALIEQTAIESSDVNAIAKARAKHHEAAERVALLADAIAAAQRKHDAALAAEEYARKVERWRQVVELSGKRTREIEVFERDVDALAKRRNALRTMTAELSQLMQAAGVPAVPNHDPAKLIRTELENALVLEMKRSGLAATIRDPSGYELPVLSEVFRDIDRWILGKRDEALKGA